MTHLHKTLKLSEFQLAQYLIDSGADLNVKNDKGDTPLHYAMQGSDLIIVTSLIEHGADVDLENTIGISPYDTAEAMKN